jgi:diacyltrehalose acyltransferase
VNRVTKGLSVFAALLPLLTVPTAGAATVSAVPPLPSPATVLTLSPFSYPGGIDNQLQGVVCQAGRTCVPVNFPILVTPGVPILDDAIKSTSGPIIVFGYSEGAQVAEQWVREHADDPNNPKNLTFVVVGNSTRAYGGSNTLGSGSFGEVWPQSQYQVIDIARQYDLAADFPNNPSSPYFLLAVVNALVGGLGTHDYTEVNLNDPANTVFKVGAITYVLAPTQSLPLVDGLRALGLTTPVDQLQAQLKPLVDQAYNRNYPGIIQPGVIAAQPVAAAITPAPSRLSAPVVAHSTAPAAASALSTSVVSDPTVAPPNASVTVSLPPAQVATDSAPTSTGPQRANGNGRAVADTEPTTTPSNRADVLGTVTKTFKPPTTQVGLDIANASKQSPTAPTTATSTTNGNKAVTGKAKENNTATNGDQETSAKESSKATRSNG